MRLADWWRWLVLAPSRRRRELRGLARLEDWFFRLSSGEVELVLIHDREAPAP